MALAAHDPAEAARQFTQGLEYLPNDVDLHHGMARATAEDDWSTAAKHIDSALAVNPNHVDSLLLLVDRLIDGERYAEAERRLQQALHVDPGPSFGLGAQGGRRSFTRRL